MMWPFAKRRRKSQLDRWDLSTPLLEWVPGAPFTLADACAGVGILGTTGGGKTKGSFAHVMSSYLAAGFGGVFFTVKPDDVLFYTELIRRQGRQSDQLIFSPKHGLRMNLIAGELARSPDGAGTVENLASMILTAVELLDRAGSTRGSADSFFRLEAARLLRNAIFVLYYGYGSFTTADIHELIVSAPQSLEELRSESWQQSSYCFQGLRAAEQSPKCAAAQADLKSALTFFAKEWALLAPRTRSSVQATLTSATDLLSRGLVRDMLFAPQSNFSASMLHEGAILIVDFPVLTYTMVGQLIQVLLKFVLQRDHVRRNVLANPRPTFMAADEAQLLLVDADQQFQGVTRSSRTAVVYATQSISTMLEAFGPDSEYKVHSLLGNLATRIAHQQTDIRTVEYVQQLIGRSRRFMFNGNNGGSSDWLGTLLGERGNTSAGFSEQYEFELQVSDLNSLAKGGPPDWLIEAVIFAGGKRFPNGRTWVRTAFPQFR